MSAWLVVVAFGRALAQEPTDEVHDGIGEDGIYEVRVYGPEALAEARRAIVDDMAALGWRVVDDGPDLKFRGPRGWMGVARVSREGLLSFDAPEFLLQGGSPEAFEAARGPSAQRWLASSQFQSARYPGLDTLGDSRASAADVQVAEITLGSAPSRVKLAGVRDDVVIGVDDTLLAYREVLQETAFQEKLADLERSLWALWELGIPLEGGGHVESLADRRAAMLTYWVAVGDTTEGHRICDLIEGWLALNVMTSDAPITRTEAAAAERAARATHQRSLRL